MKNKILYIMLVVLCILINKTNAQQEQNEDNARDWQIILNDETNEQPIKVSDYVWVGCSKISNIDYWSFGNTLSLNKHQILLSYNTY